MRSTLLMALTTVLMVVVLVTAGCQTADRPATQDQAQRADNQENAVVQVIGGPTYIDLRSEGAAATQPAKMAESVRVDARSSTQTADGSVQGSTEQSAAAEADTSGQTDQDADGSAELDVTPGG